MKTTTKEQLAELLNGNEYRKEISKEQERIAYCEGIVIDVDEIKR